MKRFKSFLNESPLRLNGVVVAWGRFNPPTIGHETVFNEAARLANLKGYDFRIYPTKTQDQKKNPLIFEKKVNYLRAVFPRYKNYVIEDGPTNVVQMVEDLSRYTNLILIAGEDRVEEYQTMMSERIDHKFKTVEVWSSGERDPDGDSVVGMSGTLMREAAANGDFETFMSGLPNGCETTTAKSLFEDVRLGMGLDKKSPVILKRDDDREKFYSADFQLGEFVCLKKASEPAEIISVGSNYLEVKFGSDPPMKIWPSDIQFH